MARNAPLAFQHGDLTMSNLVHDGRRAHLVDFETIRAAPRDWDAACWWVSVQRYGALEPEASDLFLEALDPAPLPEVLACAAGSTGTSGSAPGASAVSR